MGSCRQTTTTCCIWPSIIVAWIIILFAFLDVIRTIATGMSAIFQQSGSSGSSSKG